MAHKFFIASDADAILTSLSCPPANCHRPFTILGISKEPPIRVLSTCTAPFGSMAASQRFARVVYADEFLLNCSRDVSEYCALHRQDLCLDYIKSLSDFSQQHLWMTPR